MILQCARSCVHCAGVYGHPGYGVDSHGVEGVDFALLLDAPGYDELFGGAGSEDGGYVDGEALHGSFGVDVGVEEGGAGVFEPCYGFFGSEIDGVFPAFYSDFAGFGVDTEDEGFLAEGALQVFGKLEADEFVAAGFCLFGCAEEAGAVDDTLGSVIEKGAAVVGGFEASADLTGETFADHFDEGAVVALAHRGVEVDELDDWVFGEAFDPVFEVVEGELQLFALD